MDRINENRKRKATFAPSSTNIDPQTGVDSCLSDPIPNATMNNKAEMGGSNPSPSPLYTRGRYKNSGANSFLDDILEFNSETVVERPPTYRRKRSRHILNEAPYADSRVNVICDVCTTASMGLPKVDVAVVGKYYKNVWNKFLP